MIDARSNNPDLPWTRKALDRILGSSRTLQQRLGGGYLRRQAREYSLSFRFRLGD